MLLSPQQQHLFVHLFFGLCTFELNFMSVTLYICFIFYGSSKTQDNQNLSLTLVKLSPPTRGVMSILI